VDFRLVPLLKGLRVGEIVTQLVESHELTLNPEDPNSIQNTYKTTRTIVTDEYELDEENQLQIIDEVVEGYTFTRQLKLPRTLSYCVQDTEARGIRIRHKLRFRVQLHNPDGHVSEVRYHQILFRRRCRARS
jgi:arrestin-related trafficking adapter 4/5/7